MLFSNDLWEHKYVCPGCGHHFRVNARQRIAFICDEDSFQKRTLISPRKTAWASRLCRQAAKRPAGKCGKGCGGHGLCQDFRLCLRLLRHGASFHDGFHGNHQAKKITRLLKRPQRKLPVIGYTVSAAPGQEGMFSLAADGQNHRAVKWHSEAGPPISPFSPILPPAVSPPVSVWKEILSLPSPKRSALPAPGSSSRPCGKSAPGFQRAEFLLDTGFVDHIVDRREQKKHWLICWPCMKEVATHDSL